MGVLLKQWSGRGKNRDEIYERCSLSSNTYCNVTTFGICNPTYLTLVILKLYLRDGQKCQVQL